MAAFLLSIGLFLFWGLLGYAVVVSLLPRRRVLFNLLLAPAVGVAVTVVAVSFLNHLGLPVARFAWPLTLVLGVIALGLLAWKRAPFSARRYAPFAAVLLLGLFLVGRPFLEFGFGWLSVFNDDLANYAIGAQRFVEHGFADPPNEADLLAGRDCTQYYWLLYVADGVRAGSELLLAWLSVLTGLSTFKAFMPLLIALHPVLASAAAALAYRGRRARRCAWVTCGLVVVSAPTTMGVVHQLVAQMGGLSLLCAAAAVILRSCRGMTVTLTLRWGAVGGILLAGLLLVYPEVLPFLGLALILQLGLAAWRRRLAVRPTLIAAGTVIGVGVLLLNTSLMDSIGMIGMQFANQRAIENNLVRYFPYYMIPSGLATLWGLQQTVSLSPEPWLSISVGVGLVLLVVTTVASVRLSLRGRAIALLNLVCLVTAAWLYMNSVAFGLFKLAMYIQPFLLGTLAAAWVTRVRRPVLQLLPLVLLGLANAWTQAGFMVDSYGQNNFSEVRNASTGRIIDEFRELVEAHPARVVALDTNNLSLAKLQAWTLRGTSAAFPSMDFFTAFTTADTAVIDLRSAEHPLAKQSQTLCRHLRRKVISSEFNLHDPNDPNAVNLFTLNRIGLPPEGLGKADYLVTTLGRRTVLNRRQLQPHEQEQFLVEPISQVHNRLMFVTSDRGRPYFGFMFGGWDKPISFGQIEDDIMIPGGMMAGVGRHLLFQVVNPTPRMRLQFDLSISAKADHANVLPSAAVIGDRRVALPLVGRGSARVFSAPLEPQTIHGQTFVALDLGTEGSRFPFRRVGLMALWGKDISLDHRTLVGFTREISLITDEEYEHLKPPNQLAAFPRDVASPDLEYSGLYEDGWVAEQSYYVLTQPGENQAFMVRGMVPQIGDDPSFYTVLRVKVDGRDVMQKVLRTGDFEVRCPVPGGAGRRKVELSFDKPQALPEPDGRPACALLSRLGFEPAGTLVATAEPPIALAKFPEDLDRADVEYAGISKDGWAAASACCVLSQPEDGETLVVRGQLPEIGGDYQFTTELHVKVDGRDVATQVLKTGDFEVRCPVSGGAGRRQVELHFDKTRQLPAPDGRPVGARLYKIGFEKVEPTR